MGPYTTLLASQSGEPDEQVLARLEERYRHDRSESGVPPPHMNTRYATVDEGENDSRKERGHHLRDDDPQGENPEAGRQPCRLGDPFPKANNRLQEGAVRLTENRNSVTTSVAIDTSARVICVILLVSIPNTLLTALLGAMKSPFAQITMLTSAIRLMVSDLLSRLSTASSIRSLEVGK